ncbi:MAG: MMPL family transporter [Balneolaceae bacterium]|nr:MMPL family transporter [Balneolaceae bacterium]
MLEKLFNTIRPAIRYCISHPAVVLLTGILLAAGSVILALNLRIDNDFSKLIPESYASVQALEKLREQVGTINEAAVVIQSPSFDLNREFAEKLIPEVMNMKNRTDGSPYFNRYEYRKDTKFLEWNALWFATEGELNLIKNFLSEEISLARLRANPFYFELDEDAAFADSLGNELKQTYDELIGSEYPISADSLTMAIRFYPSGSQTDVQYIRQLYNDLDRVVAGVAADYGSAEISWVLAGRLLRTLIEIDSIYKDVRDSFAAGTAMLLLLVMGYFFYKNYSMRTGGKTSLNIFLSELARLPLTGLIMALPLGISLCWTFGLSWYLFKTLNIMTSTLILLLFGMGIDFGIHFYARYTEERSEGAPVHDAIETTFMTTGQAIAAVGITTSAAFFILMLADFKGFSEFGAIAGIGILFSILSMIFLLPALIVLLEKTGFLKTNLPVQHFLHNGKQKTSGQGPDKKTITVLVVILCLAATIWSGWLSRNIDFEYEFGKLEPVYEEYVRVSQEARKVYSDRKTRNAAYIIADTPGDAVSIRNILLKKMEQDTLSPTILEVEIFQDRYPFTDWEQQQKLARISEIRDQLADPFLQLSNSEQLEILERAASTNSPVALYDVPDFLIEPFTSKDGTVGNLVIVYPAVPLSDGRNSMNFADDLSDILIDNGKRYHAASTSIVASDMLRLMIHEAPRMVALTLSFIIFVKLLIFRSIKWMLLALLPLAASFLWLFGLMDIVGWKLNFYNIVVLPTILGIGDDSGIHMVHRYIEEGKGSIRKVLRSTGEHITVSSLTTMLGFAGLLFSTHPGMRSIGEMAVAGIGLMLLASLVLLPSLLYLLEKWSDRKRIKNPKTRDIILQE